MLHKPRRFANFAFIDMKIFISHTIGPGKTGYRDLQCQRKALQDTFCPAASALGFLAHPDSFAAGESLAMQ
jgi:hypothetical protein